MKEKKTDNKKFITDEVKEQILDIRDSGETNMFDAKTVQRIANLKDYFELVILIEDNPPAYFDFILHGNEGDENND